MKTIKKLSWKPIRRGPIYCAPACGGGCTFAAFEEAKKHAKSMAIAAAVKKVNEHLAEWSSALGL